MLPRLFRIVSWRARRDLLLTYAAIVAAAALQVLVLAAALPVVHGLLAGRAASWPAVLLLIALAVGAVAVFGYARRSCASSAIVAAGELVGRVARHADRLPLGWFTPANQSLVDRTLSESFELIRWTLEVIYRRLAFAYATPLCGVIVLAVFFDLRIALVLTVSAGGTILIGRVTAARTREAERIAQEKSVSADDLIIDYVQKQPVLRAFAGARHAASAVLDAYESLRRQRRSVQRVGFFGFLAGPFLLITAGLISTIWIAVAGGFDPTATVLIIIVVVWVNDAVSSVGDLFGVVLSMRTRIAETQSILDARPLPDPESPQALPAASSGLSLRFDRVSFGYDAGVPVLHDVSFDIPAGSTVALVGASGAGKSTVMRLAARFWDVDAGAVLIGGIDVREFASPELMKAFSIVFQDVFLFEGTLKENVLIARPQATVAELEASAARANLLEVVASLPHGWDTVVGERGATLSGGQRQRVSIARAFLKDAPFVLLDEPTAALDAENEHLLARALRGRGRDRTVLTITHRLESARDADLIVVLDEGRVVQTGTHRQLAQSPGAYAALWAAHAGESAPGSATAARAGKNARTASGNRS